MKQISKVFLMLTKLGIDNALGTLTNSIVGARGIVLPKCEVKFESVIIDDDLRRLKNVRKRQFQWTRDSAIKMIWQVLQKKIKHDFLNKATKILKIKFLNWTLLSPFGNYQKF